MILLRAPTQPRIPGAGGGQCMHVLGLLLSQCRPRSPLRTQVLGMQWLGTWVFGGAGAAGPGRHVRRGRECNRRSSTRQ
jgi:hypothetical protein